MGHGAHALVALRAVVGTEHVGRELLERVTQVKVGNAALGVVRDVSRFIEASAHDVAVDIAVGAPVGVAVMEKSVSLIASSTRRFFFPSLFCET